MVFMFQPQDFLKQLFLFDKAKILTSQFISLILALLAITCFFLAFNIPGSFFGSEVVLTEASGWSGMQRLENGFLIPPQAPNPSLAQVSLPVKANTKYHVEIESKCDEKMNFVLDFYGP